MKKFILEDEKGQREVNKEEFQEHIKRLGKFRERKRLLEGKWKNIVLYEKGHRKISRDEKIEYLRVGGLEFPKEEKEEKKEKKKYPLHLCQKCGGKIKIDTNFEKYCEECGEIVFEY